MVSCTSWENDSVCNGTTHQAWWPQFDPPSSHKGKTKSITLGCPLMSTCALCYSCIHKHTHSCACARTKHILYIFLIRKKVAIYKMRFEIWDLATWWRSSILSVNQHHIDRNQKATCVCEDIHGHECHSIHVQVRE